MVDSNVSLLFQNSGSIYVINEEEQLGFRLFVDRETGTIRRPEGNYLIYEITEEGELGERVQEVSEGFKSFDELREDGWELPWEDDSNVSFLRNEDDTVTINEPVTSIPEPVPTPEPNPAPEDEAPIEEELPITPTPQPVPAPSPLPDVESPVTDELPPIPPLEKTATLSGDFDLQFWGTNHANLIDEKEYSGGFLSFADSSFEVDAPVYDNSSDAAYDNTYGNHRPQWEVPDDDVLVSLGTLSYTNNELEDDFGRSVPNHGANFKLTLDDPVAGTFSSNFYLTITNRRDEPETLQIGFGGRDPKQLQLLDPDTGRGTGIFLDFMGAREIGASEDTPLKYSFDVPDNTTAQFEFFGRLFSTEDFPNPVRITSISDDTGIPDDFRTSDNTLVFNGTAEPFSEVEVLVESDIEPFEGGISIGTTTTDSSGNWSLDYTDFAFLDGEYGLTATATDLAGNVATTNQTQVLEIEKPKLVVSFKGFLGSSGIGNDPDELTQNQLDIGNDGGRSPGVGALLREKFGNSESLIIRNFGPFQVQQALDFINEYPSDYGLVIIGHSFGGDSTIELANDLLLSDRQIDLTIQVDSVGAFDESLSTNVKQGINYWQHVPNPILDLPDIQGADYVVGAININAENFLGVEYTEITHTNIDESLKNTIVEDITTVIEGDLVTRKSIEGPYPYPNPIDLPPTPVPVPAPTPNIDSTSDPLNPSLTPTPAPELLPTPDIFI